MIREMAWFTWPFTKQINQAFDSVTPLVAAGFELLQTTKNIAILLLVIQILTVLILSSTLIVLLAVLISINPDLDEERKQVVTPLVKWAVHAFVDVQRYWRSVMIGGLVVLLGVAVGAVAAVAYTQRDFSGVAGKGPKVARSEGEKADVDEG
ncbi:hypothetical protein LTR62_003490 [Meristemomyces frigidus]|uniref:Uncharacterized protein n=1 Tax=Meristemomyces frigidus TaxID=1508187 RepID=A0AAN7YGZ1_9PEZI|nr:hypothetical protein LTR62_003490 [Meristemomyces frigidus]